MEKAHVHILLFMNWGFLQGSEGRNLASYIEMAGHPYNRLHKDESGIQGHSRSSLLVPAGIQNGVLS